MKKAIKKITKIKNDNSEDFATKGDIRQLGAMMENMQDSISFIAENLVGVSDKVNKLEVKVDSLETKVDNLGLKVDNLEVKVDNLEVKVDSIDKRLSKVESDVEIIKSDVSDIKFDLKQKVGRDEFLVLVKRVEKLESKK